MNESKTFSTSQLSNFYILWDQACLRNPQRSRRGDMENLRDSGGGRKKSGRGEMPGLPGQKRDSKVRREPRCIESVIQDARAV